jgi:DNA-binding NarL/FixJ family response regulator
MSGLSDQKTIDYVSRTNMKNYLLKPIDDNQLRITIKLTVETFHRDSVFTNSVPTKREIEILNLLAHGLSTKLIANELNISFNTVEKHRRNMLEKYNFINTTQLISNSILHGWIYPNVDTL